MKSNRVHRRTKHKGRPTGPAKGTAGFYLRKAGTSRVAVNAREATLRDVNRQRIFTRRSGVRKNIKSSITKVSRLNSMSAREIAKRQYRRDPRWVMKQLRKERGKNSGSNSHIRGAVRSEIRAAKDKKHALNSVMRGDMFNN